MARKPRFIDGIYNYCDRWCERCPFTARCRVFAMEARDTKDPEARDMRNEAFWKQMQKTLRRTFRLLERIAARQGIDLEEARRTPLPPRRPRTPGARKPIADSRAYAMDLHAWFERNRPAFDQKRDELVKLAEIEAPGRQPAAEAEQIRDAMEVLQWYQFFIHVKLRRALESREEPEDESAAEVDTSDALGSAKVALIAMDRSLAAWHVLYDHLPDMSDDILDFLVRLDGVRKSVEKLLPQARAFRRPGLDDGS